MAKIDKDINEALIEDILQVYADAEIKMLQAVAKRVAKGITTEGWNEQKLKSTQALKNEIEKVLGNTSKLSKKKVSKGIIDAYKKGKADVGGVKGVHETILDELDIPMNLKMLILSTNGLLDNASFQVLRKSNDAYQQVMANSTTGLLAGTDTRIQASQKMLNEFASKGITTFVDKAGRNWDLGSYAEMCARTVSAHAALQGHIDRQVEVGEDLVKVSTIGTTCPICQRWQGVILSISGNHPKYHSLDEAKAAGLFHPNCKHTLGMYIPELDEGTSHEGKVEPDPLDLNSQSSKRNKLIEQQRANERNIRYWKKRQALAITPKEQKKCQEKIKYWQYKNLLHCEKHGLRRQYAREGVMQGYQNGPMGSMIGGHLKEYEQMYKDVVGESPKKVHKTLLKMNLQHFAAPKKYDKWLKEEIQSLDELDIDKAMMKDASNKAVTPTSLYKKYIGDNPAQDYAEVAVFNKGTKEYKANYAKWLKKQIDDIGVTYKVKPKYVEVHEDIPEEDKKLSATEIYKKYHDGEKPTEAFKKLGKEEGTGMSYAKWVETQKKELIKNGITKTVPFGNAATQKTVDTISQATQAIDNAKETLKKDALDKYKKELDNSVHGQYDGYLKVKEQMEEFKKDMSDTLASEKLDIAKAKHLEMVQKKAEKSYEAFEDYNSVAFDSELDKLKKMLADEKDPVMKPHIQSQIDVYEKIKKANDPLAKYDKVEKWYIDEVLNKMKNPSANLEEFKNEAEYLQNLLDNNDKSWDFYDEVSQKLELNKEAAEGTLGMKQKEKEAFLKKKKEEAEAAEAAKKLPAASNKVTLGRETSFKEGELVKRDKIYQELDRSDLENLSSQVHGHSLFEATNRRDILGRDRIDGHNHHNGHKVGLKSGLSKGDKELGEAFALAYDEYFNTIQCQNINLAYLNGYENALPSMKKKIDLMNKAIQSVELNEPVVLHRFTTPEVMTSIFKTLDFDSIEENDVFDNDTFMSTATGGHPTFGKRNYKITLQVDKGTHALPSLNHEELEVLLGKGKLQFVRANKYTSKNPQRLKNYDGTWTEFTGEEVVVRYIEEGKAQDYEKITPGKIDEMLQTEKNVEGHKKEANAWINGLSPDEKKATVDYTGSWYTEINNVYRVNNRSDKKVTKYAEDMTTAFRRAAIEKPVVLRRGINSSDLAHMLGFNGDVSKITDNWDKINEGGYAAEDKGFLSTSPFSKGGFSKSVELRIYCPSGTHAAHVATISNFTSEKETILQSGSMYKVHKLAKENGTIIAYLELLGTD